MATKAMTGLTTSAAEEHAADEQEQELAVLGEDGQAARGHGREHEAENAEGGEIDDKAHRLRDGLGGVGEEAAWSNPTAPLNAKPSTMAQNRMPRIVGR